MDKKWKSQNQKTLKFEPKELEITRKQIWNGKNHKRLMEFIGAQDDTSILDVGCGTGYIIRQIAKEVKNSKLFGIDIDEQLLRFAKEISKEEGSNIDYQEGSVYALPYADNTFDLVTAQFVLLNIENPQKALKEIYRVLKPDGKFVSIEPPTNTRIIYDPAVPTEILEIEHKINRNVTKQCSIKGVDKNIGLRIPEFLHMQGFCRIDVEGYFNIKLGSYPYTDEGIIERNISLLRMMKRQERRMEELIEENLLEESEKERYVEFYKNKRMAVIRNPEVGRSDMSLHGSLCMMTCGYKGR